MYQRSRARRRRGCWGCLLHAPLTVVLTLFALFWWCVEAIPVAVTILVGKSPDLTLLVLASCAIGAARVGPRLATAGFRWVQRRYTERLAYEYADDPSPALSPDPAPEAD